MALYYFYADNDRHRSGIHHIQPNRHGVTLACSEPVWLYHLLYCRGWRWGSNYVEVARPMSKASDNLRTHQEQLDEGGIMVGVSRQAVAETLDELDNLRRAALMLIDECSPTETPSLGAVARLAAALRRS